jgi:hypothetical protein
MLKKKADNKKAPIKKIDAFILISEELLFG